jgi:hypothetical protein
MSQVARKVPTTKRLRNEELLKRRMVMLEKIQEICWEQLQHAYGTAEDVPSLIQALVTDNYSQAIYELYGNIWHQGTVYEATPVTIPFLIELLEYESIPSRAEILVLLAHLACGHSYLEVHGDLPWYDSQRNSSDFREQLQKEQEWVESSYLAVSSGMSVYRRLLEDESHQVRSNAAYLLSLFPQSVELVPLLMELQADEEHPATRASLLLSLGTLGRTEDDVADLLGHVLHHCDEPLPQLAAAMALARTQVPMPEFALSLLLHTLKNIDAVDEGYAELPWATGTVVADISQLLSEMGPEVQEEALPQLLGVLDNVPAYSALHVAEALLALTFPHGLGALQIEPLNPSQRQVLEALGKSDNVWTFNLNLSDLLNFYGLPDWRDKLQMFLEKQIYASNAAFQA